MSIASMRNAQIAGPADCMHLGSSVYSDFDDFKRDDGTRLAAQAIFMWPRTIEAGWCRPAGMAASATRQEGLERLDVSMEVSR
jgi:hypothetical protein